LPALDGGCTMHPRGSAARATFTWLGLLKVLLRCRGLLLPHADQGGVHLCANAVGARRTPRRRSYVV